MAGSSFETSVGFCRDGNWSASEEELGKLVATTRPRINEIPKAMNFDMVTLFISVKQLVQRVSGSAFVVSEPAGRPFGLAAVLETLPAIIPYGSP